MTTRREFAADQQGMSLLEMLVASLVTTMIVGGLMTMLNSMQFVSSDLESRTSAYQAARVAMDRIQRDITLAGVGLTPMLPVFPLISGRDDGGLTLRHNQEGVAYGLPANMPNDRQVIVPAGHEFEEGQLVALYDASGSIELAGIATAGGTRLVLDRSLSRTYRTADGAAVSRIQQLDYFVQVTDGASNLMRQIDGGTPQVIATDVVNFDVTFYNEDQPPAEFTPTTDVQRLRIRVVEVSLELRTALERIQAGDRPTFELTSRISPRALSILRS